MSCINLLHLTFATLRSSLACGYLPTVVRVGSSRRTVINMGTRKQDRILKRVQRAAQLKKELEAPDSATAAYPDIDVTTAAEDIAATLDDEPSPPKSRIKSFFTKCAPLRPAVSFLAYVHRFELTCVLWQNVSRTKATDGRGADRCGADRS